MELLDGYRPTDAEAWTYIIQHEAPITNSVPSLLQEAFVKVLEDKWPAEVVTRINIHDFAVVWSDRHRYRKLATRLVANGPGAEVFNIERFNKLRQCRLEGYWDSLLENGAAWLETVFKESSPRVSLEDFLSILPCSNSEDHDEYKVTLGSLFWNGGKAHKVSNRKEDFLSHLSFIKYLEAYNTILMDPPDPRWDFEEIMREIKVYGSNTKLLMLHVAFWYNPKLKEPYARTADKNPIYYHLRKPFRKILRQQSHADADEDWETKAIALQRVVINFAKAQPKVFRGKFMRATMKFYQMPKVYHEVYHERFVEGKFWDCLAQEIHRRMPEMPFQHPDLLPYNYAGSNIYHSDHIPESGPPLPSDSEDEISSIVDLTAGEGGQVAPEIENLIGQQYGSDIEEISDPERHVSDPAGNVQSSLTSTPTHHSAPKRHGKRQFDEDDDDKTAGVTHTEYDDMSSSTTPPISISLRKRKATNAGKSYQLTPGGRRKSKIIKLKLNETTTRPSASASDASHTLKNGRRGVDFFREQVRRQSSSPSRTLPEPSPSTSSNDRRQSPIDLIPPPRRRKMVTNLPDDMSATPPPSAVSSTANRRGSICSTSQLPTRTAPRADMFDAADRLSAAEETALSTSTGTSRAEAPLITAGPPLNKVEQAVNIVLEELVDKLTMKEQVAAINAVRSENSASLFVMLPAKLRKAWLYNEIGK